MTRPDSDPAAPGSEIDGIRHMLLARPRPGSLAERRERLDGLGGQYAVPQDVQVEPVSLAGVPAEWTSVKQAGLTRVLLFLHGGGYVSGSLNSHRHVAALAGREAGARTLAVDYRLAPEHPFPAALEDALAAYRSLLDQGIRPGDIVMAGESAGGGLALAAAVSLRDAGLPLPGCLWCSSPWVDLAMTGDSMTTKADVDPLIQRSYLAELASAYLNGGDASAPLVSPLHADLSGLPPLLIQVGSAETLLDDAVRLAGAAGAAGVRTTLQIWPDMIHAWHLFHPQLADGRRALAEVGRFVRATLDDDAAPERLV